jgi:hemolysin activation/secretion protein
MLEIFFRRTERPAGIFVFVLVAGLFSHAYGAPLIPPSADTTRLQSEREKPRPEIPQPVPGLSIEQPAVPAQTIPKNADKVTFKLQNIQLEGVTAYKPQEFLDLWKEDVGKTIPLSRVYEIAALITARYRDDGYFLSRAYVPAQSIDKGIARISVIEGHITTVHFEGDLPPEGILEHFQAKILAGRPLNIKTLERQVLLLNDYPGMKFRTIMKALSKDDGAGIVLVLVGQKETKWVNTFVSYDNSGSRFIGPTIVNARFNVARGTPETTLALSETPGSDEMRSIALTHVLPLSLDGLKLSLNAGYLEGAPGFTLAPDDIQSSTRTLGARIIWEAVRLRTENVNFSVGLDSQTSRTDAFALPLSRDFVRIAKLQAHRDWQDRYGGTTILDATLSHGLEIWGASRPGDLNLSRANGRPDFVRFETSAYRLQNLTGPWNAVVGVSGQLANTPLLSTQQFGYGGLAFGRAYDSSELTGDQGGSVMAELRFDDGHTPDSFHLEHFIFYDYGKVWSRGVGQPNGQSGASAGLGTRLKTPVGVDAAVTAAQPLTHAPAAPQFGTNRSPRISFSISGSF